MTFYSIYSPLRTDCEEYDADKFPFVFSTMDDALKALKNHKDGRLKTFNNNDDAINYAQTGYESTQRKFSDLKSPSSTAEKTAFRAPTKQELVQFRKAIEEDNYCRVQNLIWDNPRYLVNSGDTPTSLKDGCRYNALHICALHKKAEIANLILTTISTVRFIGLLHGKQNTKICEEVCEILLDYYLNMPEKGRCETPLHLAAKYGAVDVVEVLTSYSQCKMLTNLENLMPKDIICSRMNDSSEELKEKIESLLQERFYVPVIRSVDNSVEPKIGEPFSPTKPPDLNTDFLSPEMEIQAYAGPMTKDQAQNFRRRWKTPPRMNMTSPNKSLLHNSPFTSPIKPRSTNNNNLKKFNKIKLQFSYNDDDDVDNIENSENCENKAKNEDAKNGNSETIDEKKRTEKNFESRIITQLDEEVLNDDCENNNGFNDFKIPESKMPKIPHTLTPFPKTTKRIFSNTENDRKVPNLMLGDGNELSDNKEKNHIDVTPKFLNIEQDLELTGNNKIELKLPTISNCLTPLHKDPKKKDLLYTYRDCVASPLVLDDSSVNNSENLENNLSEDIMSSPGLKERHTKPIDPEKGKVTYLILGDENELTDNKKIDFKLPKISNCLTPLYKDPKKKDLFYTYRDRVASPLVLDDSSVNNSENLENNLSEDIMSSPGLKERHTKLIDPEKGLEVIGRELANEQQIDWKEYWDFLGCFTNIASRDGLEKLENFLLKRKEDEDFLKQTNTRQRYKEEMLMSNLCNALDNLDFCKENNFINSGIKILNCAQNYDKQSGNINNSSGNRINSKESASSSQTTPYLCVEKSLQVFAKRCTKTILHNIDSVTSINDAFLSELKRLKSLICSFKDDNRFINVNFTYVHSRFANLIATYLKNSQDIDTNTLLKIEHCFQQIIQSRLKTLDKAILHSPSLSLNDKKEQLHCVSELLLQFLNEQEIKIQPENLKTEKICSETWLNELKCDCLWESSLSRQNSRKKRFELNNDVSRKLFEDVASQQDQQLQEKQSPTKNLNKPINNFNNWRCSNESESSIDLDNSDDDVFLSDFGSEDENDRFYTPPESPSMFDVEFNDLVDYQIYLLGCEPTKRDLDVINAIFNVEITKSNYPNIYRWRAAVLHHPNEVRDNFPSPSVVVKKHLNSHKSNNRLFAAKKLFLSSPLHDFSKKLTSSPNGSIGTYSGPGSPSACPQFSPFHKYGSENFLSYRNPRSSTTIDSPMSNFGSSSPGNSSTKSLSLMNVSDTR